MIPGPDYVYECPNCGNLMTRGSLISGNTFGSKMFSDGKRIARMLPDFPNLTKCKKCSAIFWISKLKELGTIKLTIEAPSEWLNAERANFLNIDEYFEALEKGIAENQIEEAFIRQRIWWLYNDRLRNSQKIFISEEDEIRWKNNLQQLSGLLDTSDINQKIMTAEICRNMGEFEKCITLIKSIDNKDLNWLKERLINECSRKNRWVIELN